MFTYARLVRTEEPKPQMRRQAINESNWKGASESTGDSVNLTANKDNKPLVLATALGLAIAFFAPKQCAIESISCTIGFG
jgi:hypothetical protein